MPAATQEWFATWFDTEYYHLLYKSRSYAEADAFVEKLFAAGILQPGMRVLELACGKGRHARAMHKLGAGEVVGVDLSPHSIAAAKAFEEPGLSFYVHDMRDPFPEDRHAYDACTNLFTSFGYFADEAENGRVLANVAAVLRPGGVFVLDFMNAGPIVERLANGYTGQEERDGIQFHISKKMENGQIVKTIEVDDHGRQVGPFQERVQALLPATLAALCTQAGLEVQAIYGNYQLEPLDEATSPRCILVCRATDA